MTNSVVSTLHQAASLGLPEGSETMAYGSTSFRPYRGRARGGRGFYRGAMRGGPPRASMKLDLRPKRLLVKGANGDAVQAVRDWYEVSCNPIFFDLGEVNKISHRRQDKWNPLMQWTKGSLSLSELEQQQSRHVQCHLRTQMTFLIIFDAGVGEGDEHSHSRTGPAFMAR